MKETQKFKTVITSKHKLLDLHLKETWTYRDLIFLFVKRDFVSLYKQTILGPLWAIIQPLLTTVVFTVIFGSLAGLNEYYDIGGVGEYNIPSLLFFMSGTVCWSYFSGVFTATSSTFLSHSAIMGKVYYPRLVTPISTTFSHLISFSIQIAMFFAFWIYYVIIGGNDIVITWQLLLIPLVVLQMMMLGLGCGIIVSSFTTKYRDLNMLVGFGVSLWQYATPVAYGLTLISTKLQGLIWLYMLNPVTSIVTTFRFAVFGIGYFNITYYLISWIMTVVLFFIGLVLFSRIEKTFMDTI